MKKFISLLLAVAMAVVMLCTLSGCDDAGDDSTELSPGFTIVCEHGTGILGNNAYYLVDGATNIMYVYVAGGYHAALSVYYNADGKPITYDEFIEVHTAKYHGGN